ncbi:hypothetical protein SCUP234_08829 [Seiridium cupressi]
MSSTGLRLISAEDEWSPLKSVIVGRAENSAFPSEPPHMMANTMPSEHLVNFKPATPFPSEILTKAQEELDHLADLLQKEGLRVYRPKKVNWVEAQGYTGAMPRDGLMTVGSTLITAPFAWRCRHREIELAYSDILLELSDGDPVTVCRAPSINGHDTIYDNIEGTTKPDARSNGYSESLTGSHWSINNSRPAFDAADFMRFGKVIIGQLSHVTNQKGVEYLRALIPENYKVELLNTTDEHAMHIDATLLPLRKGLMVYHPERVSESELRSHEVFRDWELHPFPFVPEARKPSQPPMYMCSPWLVLNALCLDGKRILVEASDTKFAEWLRTVGMEPILCPFQNVNSIGGSFHCATVDLVRESLPNGNKI